MPTTKKPEKDALGGDNNSIAAKVRRGELTAELRRKYHQNKAKHDGDFYSMMRWGADGHMSGSPISNGPPHDKEERADAWTEALTEPS